MSTTQRLGEVRLHTDQHGQVCCGTSSTYYGPIAQIGSIGNHPFLREASTIRVLATRANVPLIGALQVASSVSPYDYKLELGNPGLWSTRDGCEEQQIADTFDRMSRCHLPPSLGGWRRATYADQITCALVGVLNSSGGQCNNMAETLLRRHPVWPALSFLRSFDKTAACEFICEVHDPRWFVDPYKPDAGKRFLSAFGFGQRGVQNVRRVIAGEDAGHLAVKTRMVLDMWTGRRFSPPEQPDVHEFLWQLATPGDGEPLEAGLVRASRVFLSFIRGVWLDNLTPPRQYAKNSLRTLGKRNTQVLTTRLMPSRTYSPQLFVPELFFQSPAVVFAWHRHIATQAGLAS